MNNRGVTLLEIVFATAIFTVVMGTLATLALGFGDTAQLQQEKATSNDEARRLLQSIVPDLRQAISMSVNWNELPGEMLAYSVPVDLDGNGTPVDEDGRIETSLPRIISRDLEDLNGDGFSTDQMIVQNGAAMRVLANQVSPDSEQLAEDGSFGPSQDANGNGRLDRGIWFEPWGRGIRITVQTQGHTRQGHVLRTTLQEVVIPRN